MRVIANKCLSFLTHVYFTSIPRKGLGKYIQYSSLREHKRTMLFWVKRIYAQARISLPEGTLNHELTEVINWLHGTHGTKRIKEEKTGAGVIELFQLLDYAMANNYYIEISGMCEKNLLMMQPADDYTEQHQLLWCFGLQCALRPGSFGPTNNQPDYMQ